MTPLLPGLLPDMPPANAIRVVAAPAPVNLPSTVEERFWVKVDRSGGEGACWPWLASVTQSTGRGQFFPGPGRFVMCHRYAYTLAHGEIPDGLRVLHARGCLPNCCNPGHLRLGSAFENTCDARREGRLRANKLTRSEVERILELRQSLPPHVIASRFGVSAQAVENIRKGRAWAWVSGLTPARKPQPICTDQLVLAFPSQERT
jgi:hypothetical protein